MEYLLLSLLLSMSLNADELSKALLDDKKPRFHVEVIRNGLVGDQLYDRAKCAQWFIDHGTLEDVPYLIKSLSDDSMHVGASYPLAGMATTRYWANVALVVICKASFDFQWDSSKEKREYSISLWKQYWERNKHKIKK